MHLSLIEAVHILSYILFYLQNVVSVHTSSLQGIYNFQLKKMDMSASDLIKSVDRLTMW